MSLIENLSRDKRVVLFALFLAAALICIGAFGLKYGLDLQGGSYLQLKLQGAMAQVDANPESILRYQFATNSVERRGDSYIVTVPGSVDPALPSSLGYMNAEMAPLLNATKVTIPASPETIIINYLHKGLDADVKIVQFAPVIYEIRTSVTRESLDALLAPVGGKVPTGKDTFVEGLTPETVEDTKRVLDSKLNRLGLQDIRVRMIDNKYILIDLAGRDVASAQDVVGKPGKFEIRIQTEENQSMHVLYGDAVESVDIPRGDRSGQWGVPFTLSEGGAAAFQKAAIDTGAVKNPEAHHITMYLDKEPVFSAPLSPELASTLQKAPSRGLEARLGAGEQGSQEAKELQIHLQEGALPVNVEIVGSGQVSAALGKQFKIQMMIAGLIALLLLPP